MKPLKRIFLLLVLCSVVLFAANENQKKDKIKIACVGDSITDGARLENKDKDSYPMQLQLMMGNNYEVTNLGVGGCTLIRKGKPTVWNELQKIIDLNPDIIIISLGTNDTVGGNRKCWDHKDDYSGDYRDLIDKLKGLRSNPQIWICAPSPMVLETPGLTAERIEDLKKRKPRLQELIVHIKEIAHEKNIGFIDLNTPMADKSGLFTEKDGVHPNKLGYKFIAKLVYKGILH